MTHALGTCALQLESCCGRWRWRRCPSESSHTLCTATLESRGRSRVCREWFGRRWWWWWLGRATQSSHTLRPPLKTGHLHSRCGRHHWRRWWRWRSRGKLSCRFGALVGTHHLGSTTGTGDPGRFYRNAFLLLFHNAGVRRRRNGHGKIGNDGGRGQGSRQQVVFEGRRRLQKIIRAGLGHKGCHGGGVAVKNRSRVEWNGMEWNG